jgi:hypothetical protein
LRDKIWHYIGKRFDDDGVLVDSEEIYLAFHYPVELIEEELESFASIHDLEGISIEWEGYDATRFRRIAKEFEVSH